MMIIIIANSYIVHTTSYVSVTVLVALHALIHLIPNPIRSFSFTEETVTQCKLFAKDHIASMIKCTAFSLVLFWT